LKNSKTLDVQKEMGDSEKVNVTTTSKVRGTSGKKTFKGKKKLAKKKKK